jgi:hypothetical protein
MAVPSVEGQIREDGHRWTGYYTYGTGGQAGEKNRMDLVLVMDGGRIRGTGSDAEVGSFEIDGTYRSGSNELEFVKRYPKRPDIRYTGFFEEGYGIWGKWRGGLSRSAVTVRSRGEFHIWPCGGGDEQALDR